MSLYEIDIYRIDPTVPVDMKRVYEALEQAGIGFAPDERRNTIHGVGGSDEQPEYVYIGDGQVTKAVHVINGLGYTTDEDEDEASE